MPLISVKRFYNDVFRLNCWIGQQFSCNIRMRLIHYLLLFVTTQWLPSVVDFAFFCFPYNFIFHDITVSKLQTHFNSSKSMFWLILMNSSNASQEAVFGSASFWWQFQWICSLWGLSACVVKRHIEYGLVPELVFAVKIFNPLSARYDTIVQRSYIFGNVFPVSCYETNYPIAVMTKLRYPCHFN